MATKKAATPSKKQSTRKPAAPAKKAAKKATVSTAKPGNNPKVDEFLKKKNHPMHAEIQRVREIIMNSSDKISEDIKWSVPTFIYKGNIASYFLNAKQHVSLMFHYGASLPNKSGLLEGDGTTGRVARFTDMKDIENKKKALESVIQEWIKLKDAE
ncbi:MAG TPA: DUF1801 domain-containing protein [Chitinophagaceae bacterium]|nr:DUF1801 domain-containing protein [Chitinophagaceae bacterium]